MFRKVRLAVLWYILAIGIAILFVVPLLSAISVAITPKSDLISLGDRFWPEKTTWDNFFQVWHQVPYFQWFINSFKISILFTIGQLISISLTAYALAHIRFPGRGLMMVVVLATMMMPFQAIMIPLFRLMFSLGWINSSLPMWVPSFFGDTTGAFGIFLLRQAFMSVPSSFGEAAVIEGANVGVIFRKIYLPLVKPFIAVIAVFAFMNSWNDFIKPIIFLTSQEQMTVTGGLTYFRSDWHVEWGPMMAGALLSLLPTLLLYLFAQRYFVESSMSSGIKG